ncbi:outer membrane channel protein TolC [Vibrio sp. SS-MA-C1-2]|uniref:outer membrane channel protein TolC n=1 Tax=Vibrio sp. SS-MA-C1-2 TaxID=2908646 RepID=UPI001F2E559D|nr:outer membrane channel protein TolC [Vibrio sp. SS-MA-C1-2]UJF20042.1 outer membrane channel protein TolC [Vibrio sp. SS-MA-C1-2]
MKKVLSLAIAASLMSGSVLAQDLAEIYQQAKETNPNLLKAEAVKESAFEAINESRASLLPQIDLTAGYNTSYTETDNAPISGTSTTGALSAGVGLNQSIYNRANWINLDLAELNARESDTNYAVEQQQLILDSATAYFDVLNATDNLRFTRAEKKAVGRQLEQTKQRFEVGLSAITDVHDAQADYDSVLADEIIAENNLINSYEELREITGIEYKKLDILDTERFSVQPEKQSVAQLTKTAEEKNLSLLASRISQDSAKTQITLAQSGHLPTLSFNADYGYNNPSDTDDTNSLTAGVNLAVPLYTGGAITSQVKQAQHNFVSASEDLEATQRAVIKNVRASYNNINASIGSIRAYQQSVISANSALEATEAGFEVGTRTIVDVLDSTRSLYDANSKLADARYSYIINILNLKQAMGTLSEQDILDVNKGLKEAK